jgi:transposase
MPRPIDPQMRQAILDLYAKNDIGVSKFVRALSVKISRATLYGWLKQQREEGTAVPRRRIRSTKISASQLELIRAIRDSNPNSSLSALAEQVARETGLRVSVPTMHRALKRLNATRRYHKYRSHFNAIIQELLEAHPGATLEELDRLYRLRAGKSLGKSTLRWSVDVVRRALESKDR